MEILSPTLQSIYNLIVESMFTGFSVFMLIGIALSSIKKTRSFFEKLNESAFIIIRFAGILFFIYWAIVTAIDLTNLEDRERLKNRMFGPYSFYYWMFPIVSILFTQLFWFERMKRNPWVSFISALLLLFTFNAGKLIILITTLHRDYVPASWTMLQFGTGWAVQLIIFLAILFIVNFLKKNYSK